MKSSNINKILISALTISVLSFNNSSHAALASDAILLFEPGVYGPCPLGGTYPNCNFNTNIVDSGSFFELGGGNYQTAMTPNEGIKLGKIQDASTRYSISGIDEFWNMPSTLDTAEPQGAHFTTEPVTVFSDDNDGNVLLDMAGWRIIYAEDAILELGSGSWESNPEGKAELTCDDDCSFGDRFDLYYTATVLPGSPSGFGGTRYKISWVGEIGAPSAVPVPAAFWLFGSGLLGLVATARCKKRNEIAL